MVLVLMVLYAGQGFACSMYKLTANGKTMVGNNEDSWRLTSGIWFEQGQPGVLGVAYVGYAEKCCPEGAINEAGLVFDAFTVPYKPDIPGKDPAKDDFAYTQLKTIMQQCKTVAEVYAYFEKRNRQILNGSFLFNGAMLLFVDKTGTYLVVESDKMTFGKDEQFVLSNFSFADTKDLSTVKIERYRKGVQFLKNKKPEVSISFCRALSDTMSVNREKAGDGTLYTTIYDLDEGLIYAWFFHDFSRCVTFNLREELSRGNHRYSFPELFPGNVKYQQFLRYKTPQNDRFIMGFMISCSVIFLFSAFFFLTGYLRSGKGSPVRMLKPGLALLDLLLFIYMIILVMNQGIFYFPAPYKDPGSIFVSVFSYLPFVLLLLLIPLIRVVWVLFRRRNWRFFTRILLALNMLVYLVLTGLFTYWGFFDIWK